MSLRIHRRIWTAAGRSAWSAARWVAFVHLGAASALAATTQATPEQDAARRSVLQDQRVQVLAQYAAQRGVCLKRFFVNDCLDTARKQERAALVPIDDELQAVAMRGRLRAAEEELQRVQANIVDAQAGQPDRAALERQSAAREADLAQREQQAAQNAAQKAAQAPSVLSGKATTPSSSEAIPASRLFPGPVTPPAPSPAQRAADAEKAQADFAAKQKAYAEKQAEQARQRATQAPVAPLPVPSASTALPVR
ncbi:hypothetical protein [Thiomonas intermedia]|uniref:hypothetical protein n=1 Tax=Thiomonas intermedia TaxID=926 RepID=UPI001FEB49E8|nr:hypothetical protein [Thiomonas intermedia]